MAPWSPGHARATGSLTRRHADTPTFLRVVEEAHVQTGSAEDLAERPDPAGRHVVGVDGAHGRRRPARGDELLIAVADRLAKLLREGDTLPRVSGDEFVILCEDVAHEDDVRLLLTRIDDAFARPFVLGRREVTVTVSIGIAFSRPGDAVTTETVYNADAAMYRAMRLLG